MSRSLVNALRDLCDYFYAVADMYEGENAEGIDLNDFNSEEDYEYPFDKDFNEVANDVANWVNYIDDAIGSHTFKTNGKVDMSHLHLSDSLKENKKLNETWAGEDVISDLIDRAKSWIDDGEDLDDAVSRALDDGLIYTKDIRTLAEHYDVLPDDGELISLFYEELYGDVYNEASDYYDEVHEDEDDEEFEESYKRVKSLVEKYDYDEDELKVELGTIKEIFNKKGVDELVSIPFEVIKTKYPNFTVWFERYHKGMEGDDKGKLDDNSTPIDEYWDLLDEVDFKALFDFIDARGKQAAIKYYIKNAGMYDSGLDETEVLADKVKNGEIKMVNGGH